MNRLVAPMIGALAVLTACAGGSTTAVVETSVESASNGTSATTGPPATSVSASSVADSIGPEQTEDSTEHVSPVIEVGGEPCSPTYAAGVTDVAVDRVDGRRTYVVHRPDVNDRRLPLLVDLHGTTATSALQEATSRLGATGISSGGWITVTPQAIGPVSAWSVPGAVPGDDLNFVEEIVVDLVEHACADPDRVFAAGFSSGAAMATWLGCESTLFAGVAPVAGVNLARVCEDAPPVSLLAFHGTGDTIVPMEGLEDWDGDRFDDLRLFYRGDARATVESWARRNGCENQPTVSPQAPVSTRYEWSECDAGTTVTFVVTEGAGHVWPVPGSGGSVDATAEIRTRFLEAP